MKQVILVCGFLSSIVLAGCSTAQEQKTNVEQPHWLFVIHANNGKVTQTPSGEYTLTLYPVKNVNGFTDRPNRQVKTLTASQFTQLWAQGPDNFKQDHPNAAMSAILDKNNRVASDEMVTLKQPNYNIKTQSISFVIQKMSKQEIIQAEKLRYTTLFIDSFSLGSITN